jgi:hypothetical protein
MQRKRKRCSHWALWCKTAKTRALTRWGSDTYLHNRPSDHILMPTRTTSQSLFLNKNSEFPKISTIFFIKPITRPTTYPSTETHFPKAHFIISFPSTSSSTMSFLKLRLHSQHSVSVFHFPVLNTRVAHQALHCFIKKFFCKTKEATNKFPGVKTITTEISMFC